MFDPLISRALPEFMALQVKEMTTVFPMKILSVFPIIAPLKTTLPG
jgi:hypothetical protein